MVMLRVTEVRDRVYLTCPWAIHLRGHRVNRFDHGWTALMKRLSMSGVLLHMKIGGEGGDRTHGPVARTAVFETARFGHSRTSPQAVIRS